MERNINNNKAIWILYPLFLIIVLSSPKLMFGATGLNLIGFGAESVMMGTTKLSAVRDKSEFNTNPAGLIQMLERQADLDVHAAYPLSVRHKDLSGDSKKASGKDLLLWDIGNIGYVHRFKSYPVAFGVGFFAEGTARHDADEFPSFSRITNITPTLTIQISPSFFLGASLSIFNSNLNQKVFSSTTFLSPRDFRRSFFVYELNETEVESIRYKLGAIYRIRQWLFVGASYTSNSDLNMDGGRLTSDMSGAGLGKVTYDDVQLKGFVYPQEFGIGVALYPTSRLMASMDMNWINWPDTIKNSTLHAMGPDNPHAPLIHASTADISLRDQISLILGISYKAYDSLVLRVGYNLETKSIFDGMSNPLSATGSNHTLSAGATYSFNNYLSLNGGIEYITEENATYIVRIFITDAILNGI